MGCIQLGRNIEDLDPAATGIEGERPDGNTNHITPKWRARKNTGQNKLIVVCVDRFIRIGQVGGAFSHDLMLCRRPPSPPHQHRPANATLTMLWHARCRTPAPTPRGRRTPDNATARPPTPPLSLPVADAPTTPPYGRYDATAPTTP